MNIKGLLDDLHELNFESIESVKLSFVEKRKNGLTCYLPEISKDLRKNLIHFYTEILKRNLFSLNQQDYNELGRPDDVLEVAPLDVGSIEDIVTSINTQENCSHNLSEMKLEKINYYVFNFKLEEKNFYFFRRFNKQKKLSKGIRGRFTGNSFTQLEDEVFGIDDDIDIIVYENEALIINRFALQTIFDLSDYFLGKTDQAMTTLQGYSKINNFTQFEIDCKNDGTAIKRLTKIVNTPNLITGFFANYNELPHVISEMNLDITLDSVGNIDYKGSKEERTQILSCIADKYYITLLQGEVGEDKLK